MLFLVSADIMEEHEVFRVRSGKATYPLVAYMLPHEHLDDPTAELVPRSATEMDTVSLDRMPCPMPPLDVMKPCTPPPRCCGAQPRPFLAPVPLQRTHSGSWHASATPL